MMVQGLLTGADTARPVPGVDHAATKTPFGVFECLLRQRQRPVCDRTVPLDVAERAQQMTQLYPGVSNSSQSARQPCSLAIFSRST